MKVISIQTTPEDWNKSSITAIGVRKDGWNVSPSVTTIVAEDLPEPWLTIWEETVESIREIGEGEWDVTSMSITRIDAYTDEDSGITHAAKLNANCILTKGKSANKMQSMTFDQKESVSFFDYWTSADAWEKKLEEKPEEKTEENV